MRITTRTPRTTQTTTLDDFTGSVDDEEFETTVAAVYDSKLAASTTTTSIIAEDVSSTEVADNGSLFEDEIVVDLSTSTTTYAAASSDASTASPVHETADKHSTFAPYSNPLEAALDAVNEAVEELANNIDLDVQNEIGVDQDFEESQQVQQAWNDLLPAAEVSEAEDKVAEDVAEAEDKAVVVEDKAEEVQEDIEAVVEVSTASSRLTSYEKNIDTSLFGGEFSSSAVDEESVVSTVNEHGQQQVDAAAAAVDEVENDVTSQRPEVGDNGWFPLKSYVEIDRSGAKPTASVEEVQITESKDYSDPDVFYDVNKDGFDDSAAKDEYNIPVSVKLTLPEVTTIFALPTTASSALVEETTAAAAAADATSEVVPATAEAVGPSTEVDAAAAAPTTTFYSHSTTTAAATTTLSTGTTTTAPSTAAAAAVTNTDLPAPLYQVHYGILINIWCSSI